MTISNKIIHQIKSGDILLVGLSRKHSDTWTKICVVRDRFIIHSFKTFDGYQAVFQDASDFFNHEGKPITILRFLDDIYLSKKEELFTFLDKDLESSFFKKKEFKKENNIDITKNILTYLSIDDISEIENLGLFNRLV